ncbi:MAG TPA: NAD(P)H-dependent oxidoreductase [Polyangiaceae bacterium]|nr:NAD(P)H-dependent oxidoreductase [Polyangiaceae bacterium]
MSRLSAVAVTGNLSSPSRTVVLAKALLKALEEQHAFDSSLIDLATFARPLGQSLYRTELPPSIESALQTAEQADVLVVVTPVFRSSFSGLFKHFFDLFDLNALEEVPVILAATGGSERHTLVIEHSLRPLFSFFRAHTVPTTIFASERDFDSERRIAPEVILRAEQAARQATLLLRPRLPRVTSISRNLTV